MNWQRGLKYFGQEEQRWWGWLSPRRDWLYPPLLC
jgi:hypothetical protein